MDQQLEYDFTMDTSKESIKAQKKTAKAQNKINRRTMRMRRKVQKLADKYNLDPETNADLAKLLEMFPDVEDDASKEEEIDFDDKKTEKSIQKSEKKIQKRKSKLQKKQNKQIAKTKEIEMKITTVEEMEKEIMKIHECEYTFTMNSIAHFIVSTKMMTIFKSTADYLDQCNNIAKIKLNNISQICEKLNIDPNAILFNSTTDVDNFVAKYLDDKNMQDSPARFEESAETSDELKDDVSATVENPKVEDNVQQVETVVTTEDEPDAIDVSAITFESIENSDREPKVKPIDPEAQKIERLVGKFTKDAKIEATKTKYSNGTNVGTYDVKVVDNSGTRVYTIDTGSIIPGYMSVIAYTAVGNFTIAVPIVKKQKDLLIKIFGKLHMITQEEFDMLQKKYYLNDISLYNNIDFTGLSRIFGLNDTDKANLSARLRFIVDSVKQNTGRNLRYRFSNYESIDNFTLRSDKECISPIPGTMTANDIGFCEVTYNVGNIGIKTIDSTTTSNGQPMEVKDRRAA